MESESAPGDTGLPRSTADENGVAEALGRLCDMAALRRPDDPLLVRFLPLYYSELPAGDVDDRKLDDIYAVAVAHLSLARVRAPGEAVVRVLSPDRERDGWHSQHSVLLVVTDDMPFLVDTMRLVLERMGLGVHLLVHPMLTVQRDERAPAHRRRVGRRRRRRASSRRGRRSRSTAPTRRRRRSSRRAIARRCRRRAPRRRRLPGDARSAWRRSATSTRSCRGSPPASSCSSGPPTTTSPTTARSRCGPAASSASLATSRASPTPARCRRDRPVVIARTDATARVFRADRQAVVAVDLRRRARRTSRFVGLLATNAYRVSVLDIPGVGEAVADALDLSEARMHSHTGRATRTVLENLPRDLVLEQEPTAVARLVAAIVGLQERQLVRVFEVPEPVGPWIDGARVPAAQPVHRRAARAHRRRRRHGLRGRAADVRAVPRRQLAGPHRGERAPPERRRRPVDLEALERLVDELSTSWSDRLRAALVGRGRRGGGARPVRPRRRRTPRPPTAPPSPPERADHDVRRIAALLATRRRADDVARPRRRRAAGRVALPRLPARRAGRAVGAAAAARPPRPAGARRAAVHVPRSPTSGCSSTTSASACRPASTSTRRGAPPCRTRSPRSSPAPSRATGSTGSCCGAGLTAREVTIVRAYGKYLRQIGFAFSQAYIEDTLAAHPRLVADLVALFHTRFDPARVRRARPATTGPPRPTSCGRASSRPSTPSRASTTTASAASS